MFNSLVTLHGKELGILKLLAGIITFKSISGKKENLIMLIIALEIIL
jgi:hypothetical protein